MILKSITLKNFTVFEDVSIEFREGINVLIGENATGKTHLLKLLYSACKSNREDTDFGSKIVRTMLPDGMNLARLVTRKTGNLRSSVQVSAIEEETGKKRQLSITFDRKTKRWDGETKGKDSWEKFFGGDMSNFIPAKEMLSHSYQLSAAASVGNVRFDDTYIDIINAAKVDVSMGRVSSARNTLLRKIRKMTEGKVNYDSQKDEFYLRQGSSSLEFNLVAEGIKKAGLLWLLARNGTLEKGSILFWDEPEANLNPANISTIAEILLDLQKNGVQVFIATHDYFLAKYLDILSKQRNEQEKVTYYSLFRESETGKTACEEADEFTLLVNNPIVNTYLQVYRDEIFTE